MTTSTTGQFKVLLALLILYTLLAFGAYAFLPPEQLKGFVQPEPEFTIDVSRGLNVLAQTGLVFAIFAPISLVGFWFARKLGISPVYREKAGWHSWLFLPMLFGLGMGFASIVIEPLFVAAGAPALPRTAFSLWNIATAFGVIGEEIFYRSFLMGMVAYLLSLMLKPWQLTQAALWGGNIIAALLCGATNLLGAMVVARISNPFEIPTLLLIKLFLMEGLVGIVAGERYMRDGLVAAIGVHFWVDIVWHVIYPLLDLGF